MSCGAAYESGDAVPISRDSVSVISVAGSGSPVSVAGAPAQAGFRQAYIAARNTVLNDDAASASPASLLPDLPSQSDALSHTPPSAVASGQMWGTPFERSEPVKVSPFPLVLNRTVQRYVNAFLDHSAGLSNSFDRSAPYLAKMKSMLERSGVPSDFVYLAFAESGFAKWGAGPWQLTKSTARRFGLRVNSYVDERRDPIKSTRAAAEFLAKLHDQVEDWRLAVVGWNTGEASIQRFIDRKGMDYERMASSLPRRTRALLNRFMAVAFIAHHAEEYGIQEVQYSEPPAYDQLAVRGGTTLKSAAKLAHTTTDVIRMLNPALLRDRVPPGDADYELIVPRYRTLASNF